MTTEELSNFLIPCFDKRGHSHYGQEIESGFYRAVDYLSESCNSIRNPNGAGHLGDFRERITNSLYPLFLDLIRERNCLRAKVWQLEDQLKGK